MKTSSAIVSCLLLVLLPIVAYGTVWDVGKDFSPTRNPNGVWSFGWRAMGDQSFILYTDTSPDPNCPDIGIESWRYNVDNEYCPHVSDNPFNYPLECIGIELPPQSACFHPGPAQQSVVRWIAPHDAQILLVSNFTLEGYGSVILDVTDNGAELYAATLDSWGEAAAFTTNLSVRSGDVIDCSISPIQFAGDTTLLNFVLSDAGPTPVSSTTWGQIKSTFR